LVAKVPRSRRYYVTTMGGRFMSTVIQVRHKLIPAKLRRARTLSVPASGFSVNLLSICHQHLTNRRAPQVAAADRSIQTPASENRSTTQLVQRPEK
jgi:hypothetical protein